MSPLLSVEPAAGPLERVRADVAVVGVFAGERPLRGGAGRADWRLCGQLSALIAQGRLDGARGEAALVPTFGGLRSPLLLALGLGERRDFEPASCEAFAREAAARCLELATQRVALSVPPGDPALRERAEALVAGAAAAVAERGAGLDLVLVAQGEEAGRLEGAVAGVRAAALPVSVALLPAGGSRAPRPLPPVK